MRLSSIFSFDTFQPTRRGIVSAVGALLVAGGVVMLAETTVRRDDSPKSLPFPETRTGTICDYLTASPTSLDYLFIGSSQCECDISPAEFNVAWDELRSAGDGVTSFNLGVSGANIVTANAVYQQLAPQLEVGTLVIMIGPIGAEGPPRGDLVDCYGMQYITGALTPLEQSLMQLHLFRYRRQFRDLRYQYYLARTRSLGADVARRMGPHRLGWHPPDGGVTANVATAPGDLPTEFDLGIGIGSADTWKSLGDTIALARSQGSAVVLVLAAYPPRFFERVEGADDIADQFAESAQSFAAEHDVPMLNHMRLAEFGNDAFYDYTHLNKDNAPRYSRLLASELAALTEAAKPAGTVAPN